MHICPLTFFSIYANDATVKRFPALPGVEVTARRNSVLSAVGRRAVAGRGRVLHIVVVPHQLHHVLHPRHAPRLPLKDDRPRRPLVREPVPVLLPQLAVAATVVHVREVGTVVAGPKPAFGQHGR